jgi:hypothetical protein
MTMAPAMGWDSGQLEDAMVSRFKTSQEE